MVVNGKKDLLSTTTSFNQVSTLTEVTAYRRDIYAHIRNTIKHDLLVLKKRYLEMNARKAKEQMRIRILQTDHDSKMKLNKRCRKML
jgi:hypothetical protein